MIPSDFQALQDSHADLKRGHADLSKRVDNLTILVNATRDDVIDNTATTEQIQRDLRKNSEATARVEKNTEDLVTLAAVGVKTYRFLDWFRRMVRDWAWLPTVIVGGIGYFKGWWAKLKPWE